MVDKNDGAVAGAATVKQSRHRSPNYPSMGLRAAVGKIQALYKAGGLAPLMKITALTQIGFAKADGNGARALSALRSFGLIEEVGEDRVKLTQRGVDIVARQEGEPQRTAALRAAVSGPQIYRDLLAEYAASGIPPDAALKSELVAAKKFNPNAVDGFIQDFRDTLELCAISDSKVLESKQEEEEVEPSVHVGDFVQWESQGILQFAEPRRVRELSEDGHWGFVEGSNTGILVSELTVTERKSAILPTPPAGQDSPPKPRTLVEQVVKQFITRDTRQDIFSLSEGPVTIQWPATLSSESYEDLSAWLDILKRKIGRSVRKDASVNIGDLSMYKSEEESHD